MGNKRNMFYLKQRLVWVGWKKWTQPRLVSCSLLRIDNRTIYLPGHSAFISHLSASLMFLLVPPSPLPTSCHLSVLRFIEQTAGRQDKWFFGVSGARTYVFSLGSWYRMILPWIHVKNQRAPFSVQMQQETKNKSTLCWAFLEQTCIDSAFCQNLPWNHQTTLEI